MKGYLVIIFSQWKVEKMLALGSFSEWEKVKYFLFPSIITALLGGPIFLIKPRYGIQPPLINSAATLIGGVLVAVVTYFGIRYLYRTNEVIDGKNFIERCAILSVPVFVKFTVIAVPVFFGFLLVATALTSNSPEKRDFFPVFFDAVFPLLMVWYYSVLNKSFRRFGEVLQS